MPTSEERAERARVRLPASSRANLRALFAEEVAERLPRLRAAARTLEPALLEDARRDVHTLGSSAYVVEEPAVARTARAAEAVLAQGGDPAEFARLVRELDQQLAGWQR